MIRSATMDAQQATFDLQLENPGGRDLGVTRLEYEVSHGESAFPLARGEWTGDVTLPAGGDAAITLVANLDTPPLEADSRLLHLAGELFFVDRTGFMGLRAMDLTRTSFSGEINAGGGTQ